MIESTENKISYIVGESKVFPFNIRFFRPEDIKCFLTQNNVQTELVRNVDFSVERKANYNNGAKITLLAKKLPVGATLSILRICDITQDLALPESGKLPSAGLENQLDKLTMIAQQQAEEISRSLKVGVGETDANPEVLLNGIYAAADTAEKAAASSQQNASAAATAADEAKTARDEAVASVGDLGASVENLEASVENLEASVENLEASVENLEASVEEKAQTDFGNVNENLDFVVESWSDGAGNWYRKYRSGWVEQGGCIPPDVATKAALVTITLPIEMANTDYTPLVVINGVDGVYTAGGSLAYASVCKLTTTGFDSYFSTTNNLKSKYWRVAGMAAN